MESILHMGTKISTPMMLAGFVAAAFFLVARFILQKNIFPKLTNSVSGKILCTLINRFFWLALAGMLLGFVGFVITKIPIESYTRQGAKEIPIVSDGVKKENLNTLGDCSPNKIVMIGGSYKCGN